MKLNQPLTVLTLLLVAKAALAADAPSDPAAAEAMFQEGLKLMEAKRYTEACPKFEESNKLDSGVGVLMHLADCYEQSGRLASAWATFQEVIPPSRRSGQKERVDTAVARVAALEPRLPRLLLSPPAALPAGFTIEKDKVVMSSASLRSAFPVDPGPHRLVLKAPGYREVTLDIVAEEGKTTKLDLPTLVGDPNAQTGAASAARKPDAPTAQEPDSGLGTQRIAGIALGAAGLVGLGIGAGFGGKTIADWAVTDDHCNRVGDGLQCDQQGVDAAAAAETSGWVSTVGLAAGGALAATGLIVFLTAPSTSASDGSASIVPSVGFGHAGLTLSGRF